MVFLKVSDGHETRKLQLTGELSLDQLKQQLSRFFPRLSDNAFSLQYRDEDRDLITLSTDEELQAILATLPQDAVWRVQLREDSSETSLFDQLFDLHWRPFGLFSWPNHQRQLREAEERIRVIRRRHESALQEQRKQAEAEKERAREEGEEVKSKKSGQVAEDKPQCCYRSYGSWEPRIYESPFGHVTVLGPVGYHAWWGCSGSGQEEDKTKSEASEKSKSETADESQSSEAAEKSPNEPQEQTEGEATTEQ